MLKIKALLKKWTERHIKKQRKLSLTVTPDQVSTTTSACDVESALHRREYVIQELVDTERHYVSDLEMVVDGYMARMRDPNCELPIPDDLARGKARMVFCNLEAIYKWHRNIFLKSLEQCIDNPGKLGPLFVGCERKLYMYVEYYLNKPVSEFIVSEFDTYFEKLRQKLGHELQLCDYLIKPVQRLMKYPVLLKDLHTCSERAKLLGETEALHQALVTTQVVLKAANDMMDVGRLQGFDGKITAQGQLLLHGPLVCAEGTSLLNFNGKELVVFLFEQSIIFSEAVGKKTQFQNPAYLYKAHIHVNKMSLDEGRITRDKTQPNEGNKPFVVRSTDPKKNTTLAYTCQALSADSRAQWLLKIRDILQRQWDFLSVLENPLGYQ